ncbi:MAG: glycosyltransferase family 4 protein [Candidatus Eisenbacteria bacterium]
MKVCFITSVFPRGETDPTASWIIEIIHRLQARGVDIKVFCPSFKGLKDQYIHSIEARRFRYFFKNHEDLTHDQGAPYKIREARYRFIAIFYVFFGLIHFLRYCRKEKFDILHVQWPFPHAIWAYFASRLFKARTVLTFHGAELLLVRTYPFVRHFLKHAINHADGITSNSSFTRSKILEITDTTVNIVGFGPAVGGIQSAVKRKHEKKDNPKKQILFVGRFVERKGTEYLIKAMPEIVGKVDSELILVGTGDLEGELRHLAGDLGVEQHIRFDGVVSNEELNRRYREADVFVLPSIVDSKGDTEGLGVVLIEALAYNTPVIASRVGGIIDIVKHRETGMLVPEKDPAALAAAVVEVLTNDELALRLAEDGNKFIKEKYDWDKLADQLRDIYEQVLA